MDSPSPLVLEDPQLPACGFHASKDSVHVHMVVKSASAGVDRQHEAAAAADSSSKMCAYSYTELKHPAKEYTASNPRQVNRQETCIQPVSD